MFMVINECLAEAIETCGVAVDLLSRSSQIELPPETVDEVRDAYKACKEVEKNPGSRSELVDVYYHLAEAIEGGRR